MSACNFRESSELWFPARPSDAADCPECEGKGWIEVGRKGTPIVGEEYCLKCGGSGWYVPEDDGEAVN